MENVERRSRHSAANFPHLPVLPVSTPLTLPRHTVDTCGGETNKKVRGVGEKAEKWSKPIRKQSKAFKSTPMRNFPSAQRARLRLLMVFVAFNARGNIYRRPA